MSRAYRRVNSRCCAHINVPLQIPNGRSDERTFPRAKQVDDCRARHAAPKALRDGRRSPPVPYPQLPRLLGVAPVGHRRDHRDGADRRLAGLRPRPRDDGHPRGGVPARDDRRGAVRAPVPADPGGRASRRFGRPPLDRAGDDAGDAADRRNARRTDRDAYADAAGAVHRGRRVRDRPRVLRPGLFRARAQSRAARKPADRDRGEFDRVAGRFDRGAQPWRVVVRGASGFRLRGGRRPALARAGGDVLDRPGPATAVAARPASAHADRGRVRLCPSQPAGAGDDHARSVRGAARRVDRTVAGIRTRYPAGRAARPRHPRGEHGRGRDW